jgi:DNA uptake protein ComE-like DNA-binding protein
MWLATGALTVGTVLSLAAVTAAPKNAQGDSEGPLATLGVVGMLILAVLGATLAVMHRRRSGMPGSAEELSRRRLRQQYKKLIDQDRVMAVTMRLGRPDLARTYSDGGLLDLNALSAAALVEHGRVRPDDATSIVEARTRLGSFSSVDHVLANASVSESTAALLRETAIFL